MILILVLGLVGLAAVPAARRCLPWWWPRLPWSWPRPHWPHPGRPPQISILVPFRSDHGQRDRVWRWLRLYWRCAMTPGTQLVMGRDDGRPFSKTAALNRAARHARGDVYVILDADAYMSWKVLATCAQRIREARERGEHLWFIPYRRLFRLTREATEMVLDSEPCDPLRFSVPPPPGLVGETTGSGHGHWFAAMVMVLPREAFWALGGMDERFRGWGGEDVSFMHALDTLWGKHKTVRGQVLHLWHPNISGPRSDMRGWPGQEVFDVNGALTTAYSRATGDLEAMRKLVAAKR